MSLLRFVCKFMGTMASSGRKGHKLSILLYHRVLTGPDSLRPDEFDKNAFRLHMEVLSESFNVLPLDQAVELLRNGALPPRAVCITFDDGYSDNETVALPILLDLKLSATFFVATGFLDGGRMWNDSVIEAIRLADSGELDLSDAGLGKYTLHTDVDRHAAIVGLLNNLKYQKPADRDRLVEKIIINVGKTLPDNLMMTSEQVQRLAAAGMTIGAHTVHHPILKTLSDNEARFEIQQSCDKLEEIIGSPVTVFAYPNGRPETDYGQRDVTVLKDLGIKVAVSTAWGVCTHKSDLRQLPRFTPWDRTHGRFALRMLHNYSRTSADTV